MIEDFYKAEKTNDHQEFHKMFELVGLTVPFNERAYGIVIHFIFAAQVSFKGPRKLNPNHSDFSNQTLLVTCSSVFPCLSSNCLSSPSNNIV